MKKFTALVLTLVLFPLLTSCGLHPLYSGGAHGAVGQFLGSVDVAPIDGKNGWLLHNALADRFGESSASTSRYRLEAELDDKITGFGLLRDTTTTRERRTLRARYKLIDSATNQVVLDATAGSDESVDVVGSEYATIAAENTALENLTKTVADQIVARVALFAERSKPAQ